MAAGPTTVAIVLAAGEGRRAGCAKQFRRAAGRSLLLHVCQRLLSCREVGGLVLVVPSAKVASVAREVERQRWRGWATVVAGGSTRNASSRAGLAALPPSCRTVLFHDAARPFAGVPLVRRVLRAARRFGAAAPALPLDDSVVAIGPGGGGLRYLSRDRLRAVQTPQAFRRDVVEEAFRRRRGRNFTDDASVVRAAGQEVVLVEGDPANVKVTTDAQLRAALRRLAREAAA